MLAVDTNVIVRYLMDDDPKQTPRARAIIEREGLFIATTVLLEAEWVLRGAYALSKDKVLGALEAFTRLPNVTTENPTRTVRAFALAAQGMDFADALHLVGAEGCDAFVTFDRSIAKHASATDAVAVRVL